MQAGSRDGGRTVVRFTKPNESDDGDQPERPPIEQVPLDGSDEDEGSNGQEPLLSAQGDAAGAHMQSSVLRVSRQIRGMVVDHGVGAGAVAAGAAALGLVAWYLLNAMRRRSHGNGSQQPWRNRRAGSGSTQMGPPVGKTAEREGTKSSLIAGRRCNQPRQAVQTGPLLKLKPSAACVALADGTACIVRRKIAADNSCMFNAVGWCMHHSLNRASFLRSVVSQEVSSDPQKYTAAFLGMPNHLYCAWIVQPSNWGGGIELSILASHYRREIAAWNIENCKNHVFGEESGYRKQAMLLYTGTHYDALAIATSPRADPEDDITEFNPRTKRGKMIIAAAQKLVELNRQRNHPQAVPAAATASASTGASAPHTAGVGKLKRQATPRQNDGESTTSPAVLQCAECRATLAGHKEATAHAAETGHQHFAEVAAASSA